MIKSIFVFSTDKEFPFFSDPPKAILYALRTLFLIKQYNNHNFFPLNIKSNERAANAIKILSITRAFWVKLFFLSQMSSTLFPFKISHKLLASMWNDWRCRINTRMSNDSQQSPFFFLFNSLSFCFWTTD